jgi:integrase
VSSYWAEPRGDKWRACWRDRTGRTRTKAGFSHKKAAELHAARQAELNLAGGNQTWGEWKESWLAERRVEKSTDGSDRPRIEKHLSPKWRDHRIERITRRQVQLWVNQISTSVAPGTVNKLFYLFAASMRDAAGAGVIERSPCHDIELPVVPDTDDRFLTRADVGRIMYFLEARDQRIVQTFVGTGLRLGELVGLHRGRVHRESRTIEVRDVWSHEGREMKPYPKDAEPRVVPIPAWLDSVLKDLDVDQDEGPVCGAVHRRGSRCVGPLVFTGDRGGVFDGHNWRARVWKPATELAGFDGVKIHDLRHTYASWLLQAGRSMDEVAQVLGHSSSYVTKRYARFGGSHLDAVRDALAAPPATFSPPSPDSEGGPETLSAP